jgi:hypothetical protein
MRHVTSIALILGLLVAAVGCRSSKGPYPATMAKGTPPAESHSILYLTRSLQKVLHVTGERATRSPTNRMVVEVTFLNTQPKALNLQIQTTFLTEDGAETGKTNFRNFMMAAHETKSFRVTSMNDRPDRYLLQVRRLSD